MGGLAEQTREYPVRYVADSRRRSLAMKTIILSVCALTLCACGDGRIERAFGYSTAVYPSHPATTPQTESSQPIKRQVQILSEPAGARIEVNGDYIGDAPMTATIPCSRDGRFMETTTVRALPTEPGNYVQRKFFSGGYSSSNLNNLVPSRIFFDMRLGPAMPIHSGHRKPELQQAGGYRIAAICSDGWQSHATGSGACSHHGGVSCWLYSDGSCRP
jgi:hypothetical protein